MLGRLAGCVLLAAGAAGARTCHAISPSVSDEWCGIGCNKSPPTCPASLCKCDGPSPAPPGPGPAPAHKNLLGAYFANWAQYHQAPYGPYTPSALSAVLPKLDVLFYAFGKFDEGFAVQDVEPKDSAFQQQIASMKPPSMRFVLSIGGWNFPSALFSKMVSTQANRAAFISSAQSYMEERGFDGIDIDWEFPCSPARTDYVKYSCGKVTPHSDAGGSCPADVDNLLLLVKELRAALGAATWITVASQASAEQSSKWHLKEMAQYIDYYNIMTYDYSVSDLDSASLTAPNCPLHPPAGVSGAAGNWSVATSVDDYLAAGVPAKQLMVGVALYGHTWYTPGMSAAQWQKYAVPAMVQGECCGAFKNTYGAKSGPGTQLCGTLSIAEIQAASPTKYLDAATSTNIGMTSDGVWISYDDAETAPAKCALAKSKGLAGVFAFDTSMDLGALSGGHTVMNALRDAL